MTLRLQDSPDFELLRNCLGAAGYNEKAICSRLGVVDLGEFSASSRKFHAPEERDPLNVFMRLFLLGETVQREELESVISPEVVEALTNLGLATADADNPRRMFCSFALYPAGGVLTVSDRWLARDGKPYEAPNDFVYPAITPNTLEFLSHLPSAPCDQFLELCSGAGTVALAAALYARHAWAVDITERSTQVAQFNRLLNGMENVTVLKGDCYEGLEGLQFDRIVAHPPYMPVVQPAQIFYDGGQDGEQVTRRIVQGLPLHLRPGGCFYCLAQGSDRQSAPLEQRVRGWLGEDQADFDVAVVERRAHEPQHAALIYAMKSRGGHAALNQMRDAFSSLGIVSLSYGWMVVQRRSENRRVFTARRAAGARTGREEIAWLLRWETFAVAAPAPGQILDMVPVARPSLELRTVHRLQNRELVPAHLALHTDHPFAMNIRVEPWMTYLIPLCNGQSTTRQIWETCKAHNFIHAETPPEEFARLIGLLISGGFVEVADYRPPDPQDQQGRPASDPHHLSGQTL